MTTTTAPRTIPTTWSIRAYDVWGNPDDGYEANDSYSAGTVEVRATVEVNNAGTPHEYCSAHLRDATIRRMLGIGRGVGIDVDGDDVTYYVTRARDGYPLGELHCESHASLSPIRAAE